MSTPTSWRSLTTLPFMPADAETQDSRPHSLNHDACSTSRSLPALRRGSAAGRRVDRRPFGRGRRPVDPRSVRNAVAGNPDLVRVLIVSAWDPTSGVLTVYRSLARHL